jgi:integrase
MRGHVRVRGNGHWYAVLDIHDAVSGVRRRKWVSLPQCKGKREAQLAIARIISEMQTGAAIDPVKVSTREFLDRFDRDWAAIHLSAQSRRRYGFALHHVDQHLGGKLLQKVCAADVAMLYAALARDGMAPRTIRLVHSVLHRALGQARVWGIIATNPAELAKPPKVPDCETTILQPDQAALLLERLRGRQPLYLIAALALGTGLRRNEMLGLHWGDVDLSAGRLTVEQSLEQIFTRGIRTKGPKTKHGRRTISLPAHLVTELREHWREQQEQRLAAGLGKAPADAPVFAAIDGRYLSPNAITKAWAATMTAIGMPAVTLHSLRHVHASMLIAAGVDVLTISRRLGHASPTITLGTYGHLVHGGDDRAAAIMDAAFGKGSKMVAGGDRKPEK